MTGSLWRWPISKSALVVRGRYFQHAGAEFEIHVLIADDREFFSPANGRQACACRMKCA